MDFKILGPLEVWDGDQLLRLGGTKRRVALALLVVNANEVVGADRFVDGLWGDDAPSSAISALHNHISRLRKELGAELLASEGWGYVLRTDPETIDLYRFERLAAEAQALPSSERADRLAEALALWRGPPLADLTLEDGLARDLARLEERRLAVLEQRIDADLEAGRSRELIGELEGLTAENPFREHLRWQLILALYRAGRQAEALEAYRETRRLLVDELGLEPGNELRELERSILRQDPALDAPATLSRPGDGERPGEDSRVELPPELDPSTPLFGRSEELRFLTDAWRRAEQGRGEAAFLRGPPGIGKTRLAAELARAVDEEGGTVIYVPCAGASREAVENIRRAARSSTRTLLVADDLDMATGTLVDSIAALTPSLGDRPLLLLGTYREETSPFLDTFLDRVDRGRLHRRDVSPLGDEEIRSIVSLYAGWSLAHLPLAELVEATGGIPGLVHRSARDWAREQTSGRLSELASQTAAEREGLRAAERGLEQSVADFQRIRTWSDMPAHEGPAPVICPFKGLATFEADDAEFFFGRERLVAELVARLVGTRFLAVVGQSGSGKSSAVRAGLLPALAGGIIPGSAGWRQVVIRPGVHPVRTLEQALEGGSSRLILIVDQLEEIFTSCEDEDERARFVTALCEPGDEQVVVLALRADFYGRCAAYPRLTELLSANQLLVAPMQEDELRRAIEFPARRAGLRVEPELVDALVEDVIGEPGALPLLSTALLELWQVRTGRTLTVEKYRKSGGVRGAVARLAEVTYDRLNSDQKVVARAILLRLATSDGGSEVVGRRVSLSELDVDRSTDAARVVAVLTRARLLTTSAESVEVAHEALLREWPRLRSWLEEDAESRRLHGHLMRAAREWKERGRDPAELYRGARLSAALDWMSARPAEPNETEREFLTESREASAREADRQRATNRRLRLLLAVVIVLLGGAVLASIFAFSLRGEAKDKARIAGARELGAAAEANLQVDPERSILLALEAVKRTRSHGSVLKEARQSLEDAVATSRNVLNVPGAGRGVSFSPDGTRFASEGASGDAAVWDASTGQRVLGLGSGVSGVDFGSTGRAIATAEANGHATIWDAASGRRLRTLIAGDHPLLAAELGRRDTLLATVTENGELKLWDLATGRKLLERRLWRGETTWPAAADVVSFSADGRRLAGTNLGRGNVAVKLWNLDSGAVELVLSSAGNAVNDVDLSRNGSRLALARADGSVEVRDARSGRLEASALAHQGNVWDVELSSDGRRLATAGNDGHAKVWALGSANIRQLFALPGHNATVEQVSFSRDGTRLVSGSDDGTAKVWDVSFEGPRAALLLPGATRVSSSGVAFSADGRLLAAPSGRAVRVWNATTGRSVRTLRSGGEARGVSISPGGRLIATTRESAVHVWDAATGRRLYSRTINDSCRTLELRCPVTQAVFSPDGSVLAVGSADGTARILDARTGAERLVLTGYQGPLLNVAFSPDGSRLATAGLDGSIKVWSAENWAPLLRLDPESQSMADVAFSPDGKRIVTAGWDGFVRLWDAAGGRQIRSWNANQGDLFDIAFAADGRLATTGEDGGVKLWDPSRGDELLTLPIPGRSTVAFSPDGKRLAASVASDHTVTVWLLGISDLVELARGRVTRSLTEEECRRYLHVERCPE